MSVLSNNRLLKSLMPIVSLVIMGMVIYSAAASGQFVWDDEALVTRNSYIRSFTHIKDIFLSDMGGGFHVDFGFYRPVMLLTFACDYRIWGMNPFGYHLGNIILHILVGISVYTLANILFKQQLLSFWTAMLFLVHPVHTEAVAYISSRQDLLAALFVLLSFISYLKFLDTRKTGYFLLLLISYTTALFSKESALVFPLLLFLYHIAFKRKIALKPFIWLSTVIVCYCMFRAAIIGFPSTDKHILNRIPGFCAAIFNYLRILFIPVNLHAEYGNRMFSFRDPNVLAGGALTAAISIYAFRKRNTLLIFFPVFWFLIGLLPVTSIYPVNYAYMSEHWLYLPSIGFFMFVGAQLMKKYRFTTVKVCMAMVTMAFAGMTYRQSLYWHDQVSLFERNLIFKPATWRVYNNLGVGYAGRGDHARAIQNFSRALELNPGHRNARINLALEYLTVHEPEKGLAVLDEGIKTTPEHADTFNGIREMIDRFKNK